MSTDIINIRFIDWHLHIEWPLRIRISKNGYHKEMNYPNGYFEIHTFFNWIE